MSKEKKVRKSEWLTVQDKNKLRELFGANEKEIYLFFLVQNRPEVLIKDIEKEEKDIIWKEISERFNEQFETKLSPNILLKQWNVLLKKAKKDIYKMIQKKTSEEPLEDSYTPPIISFQIWKMIAPYLDPENESGKYSKELNLYIKNSKFKDRIQHVVNDYVELTDNLMKLIKDNSFFTVPGKRKTSKSLLAVKTEPQPSTSGTPSISKKSFKSAMKKGIELWSEASKGTGKAIRRSFTKSKTEKKEPKKSEGQQSLLEDTSTSESRQSAAQIRSGKGSTAEEHSEEYKLTEDEQESLQTDKESSDSRASSSMSFVPLLDKSEEEPRKTVHLPIPLKKDTSGQEAETIQEEYDFSDQLVKEGYDTHIQVYYRSKEDKELPSTLTTSELPEKKQKFLLGSEYVLSDFGTWQPSTKMGSVLVTDLSEVIESVKSRETSESSETISQPYTVPSRSQTLEIPVEYSQKRSRSRRSSTSSSKIVPPLQIAHLPEHLRPYYASHLPKTLRTMSYSQPIPSYEVHGRRRERLTSWKSDEPSTSAGTSKSDQPSTRAGTPKSDEPSTSSGPPKSDQPSTSARPLKSRRRSRSINLEGMETDLPSPRKSSRNE